MSLETKAGPLVASAAVALVVATLSGASVASEGPRYTFVEGGYIRTDIEDFSEDADSLGVRGSVAITDLFHIFASYEDGEVDLDYGPSVDVTSTEVGLGINYGISETIDVVGTASWLHAELDAGYLGDVDDDGYGLSLGLRAMLMPQLELNGGIGYADIADDDSTSLDLGAVYNFTEMFAVNLGASFSDDANSYGIGLRFYFGG